MKKIGTSIILAGGKSSRMSFDKQLIKIRDRYLIDIIINNLRECFDEIIVVSNLKNFYKDKNVIVVQDEFEKLGPLGGLHAGLKSSRCIYNYIVACDMPYINTEYIKYMLELLKGNGKVDGLITRFGKWIEPFNGFYSKNIVVNIEEHINSGQRSIYSLVEKLNVIYVPEKVARCFSPEWEMFSNINSREDLEKLR